MGSAVAYAINEVLNSDIDEFLFKLAFEQPPSQHWAGNWFNLVNQTTVEQGIREKVIYRTVLPACNAAGGMSETIDLSGSMFRDRGNGTMEVCVPDIITRGAKIVSVTEVYVGSMASATGGFYGGIGSVEQCGQGLINDMAGSLLGALQPSSKMPVTFTNCPMTGNNQFVIQGLNVGNYALTAKVILEYDNEISSIHPRHYDEFATLVGWATKAYIHRTCRRASQESIIRNGIPLDDLIGELDQMKDAFNSYKDALKEFKSSLTLSDRALRRDAIMQNVIRRI